MRVSDESCRSLIVMLVTAVALAWSAAGTRAAGLGLAWSECAAGGGLSNRIAVCSNPLQQVTLAATFTLDAPVDSVVTLELVVDLVSELPTLPDFWRFEPGGCNAGALTASADFSTLGACADPWNASGTGLVQVYATGQPRGGANQARIVATTSVLAAQAAELQQGSEYYAGLLTLSLARGAGTNSCAGCLQGACLVFNSVTLGRLPGAGPEFVVVSGATGVGDGTPAVATWQNQAAECAAVPVRNRTWGAIKSLYR